jgi:lipopolysaccharide transport system ATP-binding protein
MKEMPEMTEVAVSIKNLSKGYRIGLRENKPDTLGAVITGWLKSPLHNFKALKGLGKIDFTQEQKDVHWALKDINFEVKRGEVLGIIGHNGAGKSTLLKILSRITDPSVGEIMIEGRVASLLEVGTGFNPELTGRENVYLNGAILGMTKKEIERKFDQIIDFSGIEKFIDTPVKRYSSGMKVRLAFSVAAHLEPEILIIDEVLAVGDAEFQRKCLGKMQDVADKEGRTVIFVSHDMIAIQKLCTSAILLQSGTIVRTGDAKSVVGYYLSQVAESYEKDSFQDRRGAGPAYLKSVTLSSPKGQKTSSFSFGEAINFSLEFESGREMKSVVVSMAVRTIEGNEIFYSTSKQISADLNFLEGINRVGVMLSPNFFMPGIYFIRTSVNWNGSLSDRVNDAASFEIMEVSSEGLDLPDYKVGFFYYPLTWNFEL